MNQQFNNSTLSFSCGLVFVFLSLFSPSTYAGTLTIWNDSNASITCKSDGYKLGLSGIEVEPNQLFYLSPLNDKTISWVKCGKLEHQNIGVTSKSSDHLFVSAQYLRVINKS